MCDPVFVLPRGGRWYAPRGGMLGPLILPPNPPTPPLLPYRLLPVLWPLSPPLKWRVMARPFCVCMLHVGAADTGAPCLLYLPYPAPPPPPIPSPLFSSPALFPSPCLVRLPVTPPRPLSVPACARRCVHCVVCVRPVCVLPRHNRCHDRACGGDPERGPPSLQPSPSPPPLPATPCYRASPRLPQFALPPSPSSSPLPVCPQPPRFATRDL